MSIVVRDRGKGFDPDAVPADRKGLAESIHGRMTRRGGTATVTSAPGEGTKVTLTMPRAAGERSAASPESTARCSERPPRVVLVDDHGLFRSGVRAELGRQVEVVGEADDVQPAIDADRRAAARRRPARRAPARRRRPGRGPGGQGRASRGALPRAVRLGRARGRDRGDQGGRAGLRDQDDLHRRAGRRGPPGRGRRRGVLAPAGRVRARRVRRRRPRRTTSSRRSTPSSTS